MLAKFLTSAHYYLALCPNFKEQYLKETCLNMTRPDSTFAPECSISSCVCDLTQDLKPHDEEDHQPGMPTLGDFLYSA